ncbi:hypothetical protein OIU77_029276 [Salix suchowensis]|uniref:FHA domain-containing protein n=1 Tax=Salix suchowensis TaxID=1278906 RepID=A0ABQ9BKD3_9ROSI|nr:hypothetical protein OIU77_029276 [Salix suchowensis]
MMDITTQSLSHAKLPGCSSSVAAFHSKASLLAHNSITFQSPKNFFAQLQGVRIRAKKERGPGAVHSSGAERTLTEVAERWLLVPVGDGDSSHIGFKVKMPDAFEIASSEVTVGRLPDKADMVIPVATVSALHARIQNKGGNLVVTDLDSTNGTFIDKKRLPPWSFCQCTAWKSHYIRGHSSGNVSCLQACHCRSCNKTRRVSGQS